MMKRKIGSILFFTGFLLLIYSGINYVYASESLNSLGMDIIAGKDDITPLLISGGVMLLGILFSSGRQ